MSNQQEVEAVLKEGNMMTHSVVDTAKLPFSSQLELIRRTNILIGVHGAGLMLILFAADEAVLLEIHPSSPGPSLQTRFPNGWAHLHPDTKQDEGDLSGQQR